MTVAVAELSPWPPNESGPSVEPRSEIDRPGKLEADDVFCKNLGPLTSEVRFNRQRLCLYVLVGISGRYLERAKHQGPKVLSDEVC